MDLTKKNKEKDFTSIFDTEDRKAQINTQYPKRD